MSQRSRIRSLTVIASVGAAVGLVLGGSAAAHAQPAGALAQHSAGTLSADADIRVMTWNIHNAVAADNPGVVDEERIAAVIADEDPDVVVLNEVHRDPPGPGSHGDQPAELAALLADDGFAHTEFGLTETDLSHGGEILPGSTNGNMILSKHPFVGEPELVKLPNENYEPGGKDRRSMLGVTVDVPGVGPVDVHGTHLSTPRTAPLVEDQKEQVGIILDNVETNTPAVLAGDFNIRVTDVIEQEFSQNNLMQSWIADAGLADTWRQVNNGSDGVSMTASYGRADGAHPDRRIDYVYASPAFEVLSGHVSLRDRYASDHLAVVMDLRLTGAPEARSQTVLAGPEGLDGWAQATTQQPGHVKLSVCKNRGNATDDGTLVRATVRDPGGEILHTVSDGGTSRDVCTVEQWRGNLPRGATLETTFVAEDGTVLHRTSEVV